MFLARLPAANRRKVGMMSSQHGPYTLGDTHATMPPIMRSDPARASESANGGLVQIGGCNSPP